MQNSVSPNSSNVDGALNRAFYKIEEALWSFPVSVKEKMKEWKVLDIGASPGFYSFLSNRQEVGHLFLATYVHMLLR